MSASNERPAYVLRLDSVDYVRGGSLLLDGISFGVRPGEHWAIVGPNGAGKSTMLNLCGAVQHPTRGAVEVLGERLGRVDVRDLRMHLGHVTPRHPLRSDLSVLDVVLTGVTGSIEPVPRWSPSDDELDRAHLLVKTFGIDAPSALHWSTMSQGERGRALIARALMPDPALLLLDEPTTGLDVAAREQLLRTLDTLAESHPLTATVLVTHHFEELPRTTSHAVLLRSGRILDAGPADDVLTSSGVSSCFDLVLEIARTGGRWHARAI